MSKFFFTVALAAFVVAATPVGPLFPQPIFAQDAKPEAKPKKAPSPGLQAWYQRQRTCGAEWKQAKAAGKIAKGQTWPKFLSECNKRLKAAH